MGAAYGDQGGLPIWHLDAIAAGQPVRPRWDPIPYSPIHDDDIAAQVEALLDAATVPATIVNWCGDDAVSVQEWSAYFGELLGVEAGRGGGRIPARRVGSVGDPTKRASITGPCRVGWRDGFRRDGRALLPGPHRAMTDRYPTARASSLAEARTTTGLDDFGPGDFRDGLDVLLESLERDAELSPAHCADVVGDLRRRLVNRLEVEAWYRDHPEIADLPVRGPVDINGLPRTGTTALANMMSLDPQFRCLRRWEQAQPCPPPIARRRGRRSRGGCALAQENDEVSAELKAMHLYEVDATMEDTELLGMAFHGQQFTLPVYGYHAWWRATDMTASYDYHRRVVQALAVATSAATSGCSRHPTTTSTWRRSGGVSRRALRHDAPRPGKVGAVVGEHRVDHPPGRRGRSRPAPARSGGVGAPPGRSGAHHRRTRAASARRASTTCTTASWSPIRWARCATSTSSSASSSAPRWSRRSATGRSPIGKVPTAPTRTPPSNSA